MNRVLTVKTAARYMKSPSVPDDKELIRGIAIDSRTTKPGDLFFALKGASTDGHNFVNAARSRGAVGVVVQNPAGGRREIVVRDTLTALGDLARAYRQLFNLKIIGITGTNGKTTVRNLVRAILRREHRVMANVKNYNSLIGLPLTIFMLGGGEEFLIAEMGTNHPGEIRRLCEICPPDYGIITNVGPGHLDGLVSVADVAREKLALIEALPEYGFGIIHETLGDVQNAKRCYRFSAAMLEDVKTGEAGSEFTYDGERFHTPLLGPANVLNCLAALLLASRLGIGTESLRKALAEITPEPGRLEPIRAGGLLVINDAYNANPASMQAAIEFAGACRRRRIFVLGDMLELGPQSDEYHDRIGVLARQNCDKLLTIGDASRRYGGEHFADAAGLVDSLMNGLEGGEVVLVKASRALRFETVVEEILRALR